MTEQEFEEAMGKLNIINPGNELRHLRSMFMAYIEVIHGAETAKKIRERYAFHLQNLSNLANTEPPQEV